MTTPDKTTNPIDVTHTAWPSRRTFIQTLFAIFGFQLLAPRVEAGETVSRRDLSQPDQAQSPQAAETQTRLLKCHVAGTSYRDLDDVEPAMRAGDCLHLKREPSNPADRRAIAIYTEGGAHLGYIPRAKNEVLSRLMDSGKTLRARLVEKEWEGYWLRLDVEVYLWERGSGV